jgi:hypothetical protein
MVQATSGQIKPSQLHSHIDGGLHGALSDLMQRVVVDLSDRRLGLLSVLQIWQDPFLDVSLAFVVRWGEVISLEQGC